MSLITREAKNFLAKYSKDLSEENIWKILVWKIQNAEQGHRTNKLTHTSVHEQVQPYAMMIYMYQCRTKAPMGFEAASMASSSDLFKDLVHNLFALLIGGARGPGVVVDPTHQIARIFGH